MGRLSDASVARVNGRPWCAASWRRLLGANAVADETVYDRIACRELATRFQGRAAVILPAAQVNRPRGTIDFHVSKR